jgi:hypothetical protein
MKQVLVLMLAVAALSAADKKRLPNQAGNDNLELTGAALLDPKEIRDALGAELDKGYVVIRVRAMPKTGEPMRIGPDDFTLISRKDGQRGSALNPSEIAGSGVLVVKAAARQPGGLGTNTNGPIWGGIGGGQPRRLPGPGGGIGNSGSVESGTTDVERTKDAESDNELLAALKEKILPYAETRQPVEGLLYFVVEGKVKAKDLSLFYRGPGGQLDMDFK